MTRPVVPLELPPEVQPLYERLLVADPEIAGGAPTFVGTQIRLFPLVAMIRRGQVASDLRDEYGLEDVMVRLATVCAAFLPPDPEAERGSPR